MSITDIKATRDELLREERREMVQEKRSQKADELWHLLIKQINQYLSEYGETPANYARVFKYF